LSNSILSCLSPLGVPVFLADVAFATSSAAVFGRAMVMAF